MGKASSSKVTRKQKMLAGLEEVSSREGELVVSFMFDGQLHKRTHQFTASEMARMKEMCVEVGDAASDQVVWRLAVRNAGWFAENVLAVAGQAYVLKHNKNAAEEQKKMQTVFDTPAATYKEVLGELADAADAFHSETTGDSNATRN